MAVSVATSGSQTATLGTEHTLATITAAGVYQLAVDMNAMLNGETLELKIYGKARTTDTERLMWSGVFVNAQTGAPLPLLPPLVSPHSYRVTLKQTGGTGRAYPWAVYQL